MSEQIPVSFKQQFHDNYILLSQQRESRLWRTVRTDPNSLQGKLGYFDRIGSVDAQEITDRHGDTKIIDTPHSRRRIILRDFDIAQLIDKQDKIRVVTDPASKYLQVSMMAMNRKKDDLIIAAASGNAYSMDADDAATGVPLPGSQKVAAGAAGLTIDKLRSAKEVIDGSDVDPDEPRYAVIAAKQVTDLLKTTEVTSTDYNTVKALVEGRINTFLGFEFIRSERLLTDGNGDRLCLFYTQQALGIGVGMDVETDIGPRRDKRNAQQTYVAMSMDATRIEDEKLVEVACVET